MKFNRTRLIKKTKGTILLAVIILSIIAQSQQANFELSQVLPVKVITPNGDGINDKITFIFNNPRESIVSGCIYDMSGAFVADLIWAANNSSLAWDGKDRDGNVVRDGIYVYQIRTEGKAVNGTLVVIK